MLNIRILAACIVATTLTNAFTINDSNKFHQIRLQNDDRSTTTTQLFQRPLSTAMYYGYDDASSSTMTLLEEVIRNVRVQEVDASIDILSMPVFGGSDHHHVSSASSSASSSRSSTTADSSNHYYPMASMMQGSAGYIAQHAGSIAVFHLPEEQPDSVLRDIGLCYLLGLKIILVVSTDCNNAKSLRQVEETVGYLRTEVERKLNRFLCMDHQQHVSSSTDGKDRPNVVSGNSFCTGKRFSPDAFAGKATHVSAYKIHQSLHQNDNILVLTNVILDKTGDDWVCTDGCQLASKVAVELQASKLILLRNTPKLLTFNDAHVQDIPLSLAKSILEAQVGGAGDSNSIGDDHHGDSGSSSSGAPDAFWRELHWAAYAVDKGTSRAHLVNAPLDGALLEELFTAVNGANTCLYHDDELLVSSSSSSSSIGSSHNNNNKNNYSKAAAMTYSDFVPRNGKEDHDDDQYYYESNRRRKPDNNVRYF